MEKNIQPVAYISEESLYRLKNFGGNSRGVVPVHSKSSVASRIPLYQKKDMLIIQARLNELESGIRQCLKENTAFIELAKKSKDKK